MYVCMYECVVCVHVSIYVLYECFVCMCWELCCIMKRGQGRRDKLVGPCKKAVLGFEVYYLLAVYMRCRSFVLNRPAEVNMAPFCPPPNPICLLLGLVSAGSSIEGGVPTRKWLYPRL